MRKDAPSSLRTSILSRSIKSPRTEIVGQDEGDHATVAYKCPGMVYDPLGFLAFPRHLKNSLLALDILCVFFSPPRKTRVTSGAAGGFSSHIEVAGFATMGVSVTKGNHAARDSTR